MNDRSGPLDWLEIFTTTTIVSSRTRASTRSVIGLLFEYRNSILIDLSIVVKFDIAMDEYIIDDKKIVVNKTGFVDIMICWFGVIATKYANITNIPATYTRNTMIANHVDVVMANVMATIMDMANSLNAAVIGFGASSIDDDRRIIIDRVVDMIIYKFWGWTKSINFKG